MAVKKSQGAGAVEARRQLLEKHPSISRARQCRLLGVPRSGSYYKSRPRPEPEGLRAALSELYRLDPCLGLRKLPGMLERDYGIRAGAELVARVRGEMGLRTIYRHPATSRPVFTALVPTPEPTTGTLSLLALAALAARRRRKQPSFCWEYRAPSVPADGAGSFSAHPRAQDVCVRLLFILENNLRARALPKLIAMKKTLTLLLLLAGLTLDAQAETLTWNGSGEVVLDGTLKPGSVLVEADNEYTFSGTGKLSGSMQPTKNGSGTLTINTAND